MKMTLYVGCGGTAIRTLVRLHEKIAEGTRGRDFDGVFLAVDSDGSALEQFESVIWPSTWMPPICKVWRLAGGMSSVKEIVRSALAAWRDKGDLSELAQHWWFAPPNGTGPKPSVGRLNEGAQALGLATLPEWSAATAYLTAWHGLPRLDSIVRDVVSEGCSRLNGRGERKWDVWIVAGLAGATGRGCWAITAMKIRQCFREFGIDVRPRCVFLDASCYGDIGASMPEFVDWLRLNSLLAFSELSAWLKVGWREAKCGFSLPSLQHPENAHDPGAIPASASNAWWLDVPVSEAYVVSRGTAVPFASCHDYSDMVATALHAQLIDGRLGFSAVNRLDSVMRLSAASFVVDTPRLRALVDHMSRLACVKRLCECGEWKEGEVRISRILSSWQDALGCIRMGVNQNYGGCLETFDELAHAMLAQHTANVVVIGNGLRRSLAFLDCDSPLVSSIAKSLLADMGLADEDIPGAVFRLIELAYAPEGETPSVERAGTYANKLSKALDLVINKISSVSESPVSAEDQTAVADAFVNGPYQTAQRSDGILSRLIRPTFTRNAVDQLRKEYVDYLYASFVVAVRSSVIPKLEQMRDELRKQCEAVVGLSRVLQGVLRDMENEGTRFKAILADPKGWMDRGTIPGVLDESPFKRVLLPIVTREEIMRRLVREDENLGIDVAQVQAFCRNAIKRVSCANADDLYRMGKEFARVVGVSVRPVSLDELGFSFMDMLRQNVSFWNGLLEASAGEGCVHEDLKSRLKKNLGLDESDFGSDARGFPNLDVETVLKGIVVSTCARCRLLDDSCRDSKDTWKVGVVLVPTDLDDRLRKRIEVRLNDEQMRDFVVDDLGKNGWLSGPPDGVVASLSLGVQNGEVSLSEILPSSDGWQSPKLLPQLNLAEDPDGAAYFEKSAITGYYFERRRAVGYVSPIFVRHPEMSKGRWRPWGAREAVGDRANASQTVLRSYDVFISYRRDGGVDPARMLALKLEGPAYGYKVFFDQDSIRQGVFNQVIFKAIDECRYFVLVVTEGAFDRCAEEDDWVRQEVERALKAGKTIVPVAPYPEKSCAFPKDLPPSMAGLANLQIAELNMRQLFDVSVRQMVGARFV